MAYSYKQLGSEDVPMLQQLVKVFGEAFEDMESYQGHVPSEEYLRSLLRKSGFIVVVATVEDQVVGGLAAYVLEKFEQERREIYIYDLAVQEHHRRRGMATKLIDFLRRIAQQRGAYVIYVQADKADEAAIKLYESMGTKQDVLHFDIAPY